MPWIKEVLMAVIMASNILAMPSPQRRSAGGDENNLEGPVDPTKCPGGDWCGITSRSIQEQNNDQPDDDTIPKANVTIIDMEKADFSTTESVPDGVLSEYWWYTASIYYRKIGSSPARPVALAFGQADFDRKKRDELSNVNAPPGTNTAGLKPVNIVSVHGVETVFAGQSGGSMRAGNAVQAEKVFEQSHTTGGTILNPNGSWEITINLRILWHHLYTDTDFDALRDYLVQSGESKMNVIAALP